jgi:hypothetical protein
VGVGITGAVGVGGRAVSAGASIIVGEVGGLVGDPLSQRGLSHMPNTARTIMPIQMTVMKLTSCRRGAGAA